MKVFGSHPPALAGGLPAGEVKGIEVILGPNCRTSEKRKNYEKITNMISAKQVQFTWKKKPKDFKRQMLCRVGEGLEEQFRTVVRYEAVLCIGGILVVIGSLGPWETFGGQSANALGDWYGNLAFIGGFLAIFGALISYRYFRVREIEKYRPYIDAGMGASGGLLVLIAGIGYLFRLGRGVSPGWGLILTILASLLVIYSAYRLYFEEVPPIPKGFSALALSPAEGT